MPQNVDPDLSGQGQHYYIEYCERIKVQCSWAKAVIFYTV